MATTTTNADADWEVPPGEDPARCPRCGRPFGREQYRDLHLADHGLESLSELERTAYEAARDAEEDDLFRFHLQIVGALALIYAVFVLAYMVVGV